MIWNALRLVVDDLKQYIASTNIVDDAVDTPHYVVLGNIALADAPELTPSIRQRTVVSVVNIHEESTLKNNLHYERIDDAVRYRNAPVHLNLFLLFSANYDNYENALIRLSQVIEFFQAKRVFTYKNTPVPAFIDDERMAELKLIMDLYALTFEQVNHLWGSLGGKQVPFVLYKLRLVKIDADRTTATGSPIEEVRAIESIN